MTAGPSFHTKSAELKESLTLLRDFWFGIVAFGEVGPPSLGSCQVRTITIGTATPFSGRTAPAPTDISPAPQRGNLRYQRGSAWISSLWPQPRPAHPQVVGPGCW